MKLKIKKLKFLTGRPVCIVHEKTANKLSVHVGERVSIKGNKNKQIISVVDTVSDILKPSEIAVSEEIIKKLNLKPGQKVKVELTEHPHSIELIKKKLKGKSLSRKEIKEIVTNIANNSLTEVEVAFFVSAIYEEGMNLNEVKYLIQAMIETGNSIKLKGKVVDKHSVGGGGNRTTPIIVSICAASGLTMPKTSSRAITSAAGTADVIETIANVDFSVEEIKKIIKKTKACFVWGGSLGLAPVDDKIIKIENIVTIDSPSQLLVSILSKKISVGSKYILIDIPYGKSSKIPTRKKAEELKNKFLKLAKAFYLRLEVLLTDGREPIGNGIGPVLEMRDVIKVLKRDNPPKDLEEKSLMLSGKLLELTGKTKKGKGYALAKKILDSGEAFRKFTQIIKAQKGNIEKLKKIQKPDFSYDIKSKKSHKIKHLNIKLINGLARSAGCPEDKSAGVYIHKKKNDLIKKGEKILTVYSISKEKLKHAIKFYNKNKKHIIEFRS